MNTGESFYEFIANQQYETKKIINVNLYYGNSFENYLKEYLAGIDSDTGARFESLTNMNIKYLLYRYNDFHLSRGLSPGEIRHSKRSAEEIVMEELQNRNWQYLIESLIYKVEKDRDYYKIKTKRDSDMIASMEKNYKMLRRVYDSIIATITENFQLYLNSPSEEEVTEIDSDFVSSSLASIRDTESAFDLVSLFDFFYFVNRRFPTATGITFVPKGDFPLEVTKEEVNIKKLYEKFQGTNSHALVTSQFLAALNIFFCRNPETSRKFLTELYQNLTVRALSTDYAFSFDQLTNILAEISILLRRLADDKIIKKEDEDFKLEDEIDNKFNLPEIETNNEDEIIDDSLNVERENADEKSKQFEPYVERQQIEYFEKIKEEEINEIDKIMDGVEPITTEENIEKTIEDIVKGEENNVDSKIEDIL